MPLDLDSQIGTAGQYSGLEVDEFSGITEFSTSFLKRLLYHTRNILLQWPYFDWMQIILFVIVIQVDPLSLYIPAINDVKKCLDLHYRLLYIAYLFSYVLLAIYTIIFLRFSSANHSMHIGENSHKNQGGFIIINFLIFLPISQMASILLNGKMGDTRLLDLMKYFKILVCIQYAARIIRIYSLFSAAIRSSTKLAEAKWARVAFIFFLYLQAANVFGSLWYFMAIERETECWRKACINHTGQIHCSFECRANLEDYTFLNGLCPTKTRNRTIHDFGIFHVALESGIVEGANILQKYLHCFVWGLQNLSNLGHNLQTSSDVPENIFVILVVTSSFLFYTILIGNMQTFLQSRTTTLRETTLKPREIEEWEPYQMLSEDLQQQVKKYKSYIRRKTNHIDVENLLNNLPKELRRKIKHELCWDLLKKVKELMMTKEETLDALCDCVNPVFFTENTHILREGDPLDEIIFVVKGKIRSYTFNDITSGSTSSDYKEDYGNNTRKNDLLKDGDFYGEELVDWAMRDGFSLDIPKSTRTIQALTNVEAFTLMADDLKSVLIEHEVSRSYGEKTIV